jgi:equilibrative nucleoside transporter 1/2/3
MAASLAVFPAVTAFICSVHNPAKVSPCAARAPAGAGPLAGDLFVPFGFVVFSLGDLSGRVLSSLGPWGRTPPPAWAVALYAVARVAIAAATLFCRVVTPSPWRLPTLLRDDRAAWGVVFSLGLTQGHLLSTACMHAPAVVPRGREAEFGPVTGVCITVGCLAGSVASVGLMRAFAG